MTQEARAESLEPASATVKANLPGNGGALHLFGRLAALICIRRHLCAPFERRAKRAEGEGGGDWRRKRDLMTCLISSLDGYCLQAAILVTNLPLSLVRTEINFAPSYGLY